MKDHVDIFIYNVYIGNNLPIANGAYNPEKVTIEWN